MAPTNLIINGSFEKGRRITSPNGIRRLDTTPGRRKDILGWEVIRDEIDYKNKKYWKPSNGSRSIDLNGSPGAGAIAQTFATTPGKKYKITFDLAGNPVGGTNTKRMRLKAGGQSADFTFNTAGKTLNNMGWQKQTFTFTATRKNTKLQFISLSRDKKNGRYGPALDNVRVVEVKKSNSQSINNDDLLGNADILVGTKDVATFSKSSNDININPDNLIVSSRITETATHLKDGYNLGSSSTRLPLVEEQGADNLFAINHRSFSHFDSNFSGL